MSVAAYDDLLTHELVVLGRIMPASNHTFLAALGDAEGPRCVYKPVSGERPLWDFADGTLAAREYAARLVSERTGWGVVPPTVLRDGPAGPGMVQLWQDEVETSPGQPDPVDLVPEGSVPPGFLHVLDATADPDPVFTWVSGTGARPTLQALPEDLRSTFEEDYRRRLRSAYPAREGRVVLPFRRVFAVARR